MFSLPGTLAAGVCDGRREVSVVATSRLERLSDSGSAVAACRRQSRHGVLGSHLGLGRGAGVGGSLSLAPTRPCVAGGRLAPRPCGTAPTPAA
ncbi:hypothetical protein HPB47_025096 [Ixodes persulcatus]|uniref:Uncharacterized protein n=1 Tax=Ixodes persulcatus TaxID=34615 RepID=A0AC60Q2G1_IXOPE|nr:hypothetical protein HPB47_025096 [Ixodes persulcatus]